MPAQNKHTVFVDSAAEAAAFKPAQYFDTPAELLGRSYNRPRSAQLQQQLQQQQPVPDAAAVTKAEK
jgi:hypothetical protein